MNAVGELREGIKKSGGRFKGKKELLTHLDGGELTARQMVIAKCYDCTGHFSDGPMDCKVPSCPCYQLMPYREIKPERKKRKRILSEAHKEKLRAGIKQRLIRQQDLPVNALAHF